MVCEIESVRRGANIRMTISQRWNFVFVKSVNLIRRVNFEFANPVKIRKGCEFEDQELSFSKMITKGFHKGFAYLCYFA